MKPESKTKSKLKLRSKSRHILLIVLISVGSLLFVSAVGFFIYVGIYYHADGTALSAMISDDDVTVSEQDGTIVFAPKEPECGLIFYPGGKVEHRAYAPLMKELAKKNILCVVPEMPYRLAVFNTNAADGVYECYPSVKKWYIGGHSLGGSMAALYASDHSEKLCGVILLAAYSTKDLKGKNLSVLSLYGSCDGVLNMDKYRENLSNLPEDYQEVIIEGGNHCQFGSYGFQSGDGEAEITPEQQVEQTVAAILDFCLPAA